MYPVEKKKEVSKAVRSVIVRFWTDREKDWSGLRGKISVRFDASRK